MKKIICLLLSLTMALAMTGCVSDTTSVSVKEDGTGVIKTQLQVQTDTIKDGLLYGNIDEFVDATYGDYDATYEDGVLKIENEVEFEDINELHDALKNSLFLDVYTSTDYVRGVVGMEGILNLLGEFSDKDMEEIFDDEETKELLDSIKMNITIEMPEEIKVASSNAARLDGNEAEFNLTGKDIIESAEIMVSCEEEEKAPTVSGIKDGKLYKSPVVVRVKDRSGIKAASYTLNGEEKAFKFQKIVRENGQYTIKAEDYYGNKVSKSFEFKDEKAPTIMGVEEKTYKSSIYDVTVSDICGVASVTLDGKKVEKFEGEYDFDVTKSGAHKIVARDINGNESAVSFKIDRKPTATITIKGKTSTLKNKTYKTYGKKVTVKYTDDLGKANIKSATLNGKSVKSGATVSKTGKYTLIVKDKSGNTTTIKFTLKK